MLQCPISLSFFDVEESQWIHLYYVLIVYQVGAVLHVSLLLDHVKRRSYHLIIEQFCSLLQKERKLERVSQQQPSALAGK